MAIKINDEFKVKSVMIYSGEWMLMARDRTGTVHTFNLGKKDFGISEYMPGNTIEIKGEITIHGERHILDIFDIKLIN